MIKVTPEQLKEFVKYALSMPKGENGSLQFIIVENEDPDVEGWVTFEVLGAVLEDILPGSDLGASAVKVIYKSRMANDGSLEISNDFLVELTSQ